MALKLIMVGMRYHDPTSSDDLLSEFKKGKTVIVKLLEEDNPNGFHGKALVVLHPHSNKKIGYIRNTELEDNLFNYRSGVTTAKVTSMYPNYWLLSGIKNSSLGETLNMQSITGRLTSNIAMIPTPMPTTTTSHQSSVSNNITIDNANLLSVPYYGTGSLSTIGKDHTYKPNTIKENTMIGNMKNSLFREIKNVAIDVQSGKFGIKTADGIAVYTDKGISVNPITEMGFNVPAFAIRVEVSTLKTGDILVVGDEVVFFKASSKEDGGYEVISPIGETRKVTQVTNMFFGKNTVLAIPNMFGGASAEGFGGMNPMMMAMMLGDNKGLTVGSGGFDMKTFMLLSMMGNKDNKDMGGMNPMMMALMLGGK